jgi:molecular chaperone GrpE
MFKSLCVVEYIMTKKHTKEHVSKEEKVEKNVESHGKIHAKIQSQKDEKSTKECSCKNKNDKINELTIDLKRIQAEFENYQKRTEKQNADFREYASANIISELLPVVDSLEQGIKHNKELVLVYEQFSSILAKNGLTKIEVNVGDRFDHDKMECLMQEESKIVEGRVAQVLSTGYMLKEKILRPTKISISKKIENKESKEEN